MLFKFNNLFIYKALMTTLIIVGISLPCVPFAGEGNNISEKNYPQIKNIPNIESGEGRNFLQEVEKFYDFTGTIDAVQNEGIVVDDSYFKKAPNAKISGAMKGIRVGLLLNKAGEVVLCEPLKISK